MRHATTSRWKFGLFAALPSLAVGAVAALAYFGLSGGHDPIQQGKRLNELAWESSYLERGMAVPPHGPREGYWGKRLGQKVPDPQLGWHERAVQVEGLLDIDASGVQHGLLAGNSQRRVLILGGSAAFGAYASEISKTYFRVIERELERAGMPAEVRVVAAGAWKSVQELAALERHGESWQPDVVIFLNGLNDLTNGATAHTLYGQSVETKDGSPWSVSYHAGDYSARVDVYLQIMQRAAELCAARHADMLVVLQPSLAERRQLSRIEEQLLAASLSSARLAAHRASYEAIRNQLPQRLESTQQGFLDASRIFDSHPLTTFSDQWHFSDPGHEILGKAIAGELLHILKRREAKIRMTNDE
jgi:hypothetical protein